ncbi:MAG: PorT family protein [Reichenbachiella sp.]
MHTIDIWHQLNIYRYKVVVLVLCCALGQLNPGYAQNRSNLNLPFFDDQNIHYGFLIGLSGSNFRHQFSDAFIEPEMDTLQNIIPESKIGFKLGFIVDFHIFENLDVRLNPTVSFNQLQLSYQTTTPQLGSADPVVIEELLDPTYVELPILLKYKSVRRRNTRMYALAGINPMLKASGSKDDRDDSEKLLIKKFNVALDIGVGFDLYQPLFKFSPEIRYSFGLMDVLDKSEPNDFSAGLNRLSIHTITFYITFEGGPSELKIKKKK